jgi:periplasmic protein TonB
MISKVFVRSSGVWRSLRTLEFLKSKVRIILLAATLTFQCGKGYAAADGNPGTSHGHRSTRHSQGAVKLYGAGMNEEQSLHALKLEISRKLGANIQESDYPEGARRAGLSGTTWVHVLVGSDGKIKNMTVRESSGHPVLDQQALQMMARVKLWWIPERLRHREVSVVVPVAFQIRNSQ